MRDQEERDRTVYETWANGSSLRVPFIDRQLCAGTWQGVRKHLGSFYEFRTFCALSLARMSSCSSLPVFIVVLPLGFFVIDARTNRPTDRQKNHKGFPTKKHTQQSEWFS